MITKTLYVSDKVLRREDKVACRNHEERIREWLRHARKGELLAIRTRMSMQMVNCLGRVVDSWRLPLPDMMEDFHTD